MIKLIVIINWRLIQFRRVQFFNLYKLSAVEIGAEEIEVILYARIFHPVA